MRERDVDEVHKRDGTSKGEFKTQGSVLPLSITDICFLVPGFLLVSSLVRQPTSFVCFISEFLLQPAVSTELILLNKDREIYFFLVLKPTLRVI